MQIDLSYPIVDQRGLQVMRLESIRTPSCCHP